MEGENLITGKTGYGKPTRFCLLGFDFNPVIVSVKKEEPHWCDSAEAMLHRVMAMRDKSKKG